MANDEFYKWTKELEETSKKCMIYLNEENKIRRMLIEYSKNDLIDFIMRERNQIKHLNNTIDELENKLKNVVKYIKENDYIDLNGYDLLNILNSGDE